MPFQQADSLRYYTFESLSNAPVAQAVFTRHGGVSQGAYTSLNVGSTVGDDLASVKWNLRASFEALGRPRESLFDSWLVHGDGVLVADAPRSPERERPPQADILLTNKPDVTLFMRYADCLPLLFYDPVQRAIGLAHAGWKGSVIKVAARAVEAMQGRFGSQAGDLVACIGPAITAPHYEVGPEVVDEVRVAFGEQAEALLPRYNGATHFDLQAANRLALEEAGVGRVEVADQCTYVNNGDWFSHRASGGRTGRFGVLLALEAA
jgi:YfiH family protein